MDQAQAQLQSLHAQVRQETVQLHYYRVTAPSSGIVGDIPVRVGDRVTTTTVLTTVDKPGSLEAYIYVPIERVAQLKSNLPVQIIDQSGEALAESHVYFISPQVDPATQTVLAKAPIANNNDKLRNAQFIRLLTDPKLKGKVTMLTEMADSIGRVMLANGDDPSEGHRQAGLTARSTTLKKAVDSGQIRQLTGNDYAPLLAKGDMWAPARRRATW